MRQLPHEMRIAFSVCLLVLSTIAMDASAGPVRMAIMGDSISAGSGSGIWVNMLNTTGAFTMTNRAVGGATSSTVVSGQLNAVKTLATNGQIDISVLMIGGNDAGNAANMIAILAGNPNPFIDTYVNNIKNVLGSIKTANSNVRQVFANMPDVTVTPRVQSEAAQLAAGPAELLLLSNAVAAANAQANAYALSLGIPIIDSEKLSHDLDAFTPLTLAGQTFTTLLAADNFHPARVTQGLLANLVDMAFNLGYGQTLPIFSDQQIVTLAGRTPNSATTYIDLTPYIILPAAVPEASSLALAAMGLAIPIIAACRRNRA